MNNLLSDLHNAFLMGIVPFVVAVFALFLLAESKTWKQILEPSSDHPFSPKLFTSGYKQNLLKGSVIFGCMLIGLWAVFSCAPTWIESITGDVAKAKTCAA